MKASARVRHFILRQIKVTHQHNVYMRGTRATDDGCDAATAYFSIYVYKIYIKPFKSPASEPPPPGTPQIHTDISLNCETAGA